MGSRVANCLGKLCSVRVFTSKGQMRYTRKESSQARSALNPEAESWAEIPVRVRIGISLKRPGVQIQPRIAYPLLLLSCRIGELMRY